MSQDRTKPTPVDKESIAAAMAAVSRLEVGEGFCIRGANYRVTGIREDGTIELRVESLDHRTMKQVRKAIRERNVATV